MFALLRCFVVMCLNCLLFWNVEVDAGSAVKQGSLSLSPETVVQVVLESSLRYQKIQAEKKATPLLQAEALSFLDWHFFAQTRFKRTEQSTLNFFETPLEKNNNTGAGIEKQFLTGTRLKGMFSLFHFEKDFTPEFKKLSSSPPSAFRQNLSLEIEQDLWRNIFGYEDRIKLRIASAKTQIQQITLLEATEDLILQVLEQFWLAYVSQIALKLQKSKAKDYKSLFEWTKKKKSLSYIKPGELEQVQAEWEKAQQELILQKTDYENQVAKLLDLLYPKAKAISLVRLTPPRVLPPPPVFKTTLLMNNARSVRLMKKQLFIHQQKLKEQKSKSWPTLKLFGSYSIGGYETDFSTSFESLKERKNQNHSFGIKLSYPLSSSSLRRRRLELKEQAVQASQYELEISQKEWVLLQEQSMRNLQTLYQALKTAKKIQHLRAQSYKEIRKAFLQGRLSVFNLIKAKELSLLAEQEKTTIKSRYYQALDYIKALHDTLIPL